MAQSASDKLLENESEIVERAKTDDSAFSVLYNHYFSRIYGYVFKRVGNRQVAEDIVSETFLKVFANIKDYQFTGYTFGAWIYRIATNNLIDHYRRFGRYREVDLEQSSEIADEKPGPADTVQALFDRQMINSVLNELPDNYREIINLKYFAEMTYEEIAEVLGTNVNNCRVLVFRALKNFEQTLKKYGK